MNAAIKFPPASAAAYKFNLHKQYTFYILV
jgi:hypothetical protein